MDNKNMDIISNEEFASLFQKSKELIDSARNSMGKWPIQLLSL